MWINNQGEHGCLVFNSSKSGNPLGVVARPCTLSQTGFHDYKRQTRHETAGASMSLFAVQGSYVARHSPHREGRIDADHADI